GEILRRNETSNKPAATATETL
ncbi:MAG: hypothetical protein K0Q78_2129, partial [Cellvibrio sp.]|nr:hypothetical protein [Cellvibrio sp.]